MDFEGEKWLDQEGQFEFEVKDAELKMSSAGNEMIVFNVQAPEGKSTLYFSLNEKARWKYNNFIKACLKLDHISKIKNFELDYHTIHNDLIGKHFIGTVIKDFYVKETKVPTADGLYETKEEEKTSYKVEQFTWIA